MKKEDLLIHNFEDAAVDYIRKVAYKIGKEVGKLGFNDQDYADSYIKELMSYLPDDKADHFYKVLNKDYWEGFDAGLAIDD